MEEYVRLYGVSIPFLIIAVIFFFVGFFGLIIPVIPDLIVIWLGVLIYAIGTKFSEISVNTVIYLGILSATTYLIDYATTVIGAQRYGASRRGIVGAIVGGIIGFFSFPPFGFLIGAILGIIFAEVIISGRTTNEGIRASKGVFLGYTLGFLIKIVIASVIIVLFLSSIL